LCTFCGLPAKNIKNSIQYGRAQKQAVAYGDGWVRPEIFKAFELEEVAIDKARKIFLFQIYYLYHGVEPTEGTRIEDQRVLALQAILNLGNHIIGETACQICRNEIDLFSANERASKRASNQKIVPNKPLEIALPEEVLYSDYETQMSKALLQIFEEKRFLLPPSQSVKSSTSMKETKQLTQNYPLPHRRVIKWLAEVLGCETLEKVGANGWNLLHHLCHLASSSTLAIEILWNMAYWHKGARLEGDMRAAMRQQTTGQGGTGSTPAFFLCTNSDTEFKKAKLIERLLKQGIWNIKDFEYENEEVAFF